MVATIINGNDRISLPDDIRQALRLEDGAVVIAESQGESVLLRAADAIERLAGSLHAYAIYPIPTDEELDDAIAQAIVDDHLAEDYGKSDTEQR